MTKEDWQKKITLEADSGYYLTNAECDMLRRQPVNFNDMLRLAYIAGLNATPLQDVIHD